MADDLLGQARKAIKAGNFDQADGLITQAEKLGVKYDPLTARFVDTPEKLRKLLDGEKGRAGAARLPSSRFPALLPSGQTQQGPATIPADPFQAGRGQDAAGQIAAEAKPNPLSPYALRPSDVRENDRLPALGPNNAVPSSGAPVGTYNPYTVPAEANSLAASPRGGAYRPATGPEAVQGYEEPRRLPTGDASNMPQAASLLAQARLAFDRGDLRAAQQFAEQAHALNVPDEAFAPGETRPWQVLLQVNSALSRNQNVVQAAGNQPPGTSEPRYPVAQGVYNPASDTTRNMPAANSQPSILNRDPSPTPAELSPGYKLYDEGLEALESQDREAAMAKFSEAWKFQDQLDPAVRQQLKDKLTFLRAAANAQPIAAGEGQPSPLEQVNSAQEVLKQKLIREIANEEKTAEKLAQTNPRGALASLQKLRDRVAGAEVDNAARKQLLTLVDRKISELSSYIEQNKATIENDEANNAIKADLARNQEVTIETQNKIADLVEQFNTLMDENRYPEAEVIARQARDIAPADPVVVNMMEKSKLAKNIAEQMSIRERSEAGVLGALGGVDESGIPFDDRTPFVFGDARKWNDLTRSRRRLLDERSKMSPAEIEIQKSMTKLVEVKFDNRPLAEVIDTLQRMAGVNMHLDPQGLLAEGVTSDTPVTLNLSQPISLRSALNLILEPMGLSYVIQHDVLRITSEQQRDSNTYAKVYYVADLVMPIPNFVPSYNIGLPGAIRESLNALGYGGPVRPVSAGPLTIAQNEQQYLQPTATSPLAAASNPEVLAQAGMNNLIPPSTGGLGGGPTQLSGPGGMGGGVEPDFDTLIELITTTVSPQSWDEVGGPGSISGFDTNLSLVVSQTQEVHEQIADLLEQLRRLQDLQVTIEVRFITLSDSFFERIGIDFDFDIDDNTRLNNQIDLLPTGPATDTLYVDDENNSIGIGFGATGPTADLDLSFNQNSFGSTQPAFGGFDAASAANFGFAILSDIEVFFLLQAAQGDTRTNILQAPKVTLFNGQTAFVSDTSQRPFVTSVIPVVGDFAAAHQPVIVVLNEGTSLSVQAVVSSDRRFVRLTLVPFFSQIGDVDTFTFNGRVTTDSGTVVEDPDDPDNEDRENETRTVEGTTVQLPTFAFTTVTTTVSVPDGGTVLLGGIKRLREGRNERGVPLLSKVPYISRLFKNVGIGRDAQSLMMMVTPRIIIQEEEEEKLGIEIAP